MWRRWERFILRYSTIKKCTFLYHNSIQSSNFHWENTRFYNFLFFGVDYPNAYSHYLKVWWNACMYYRKVSSFEVEIRLALAVCFFCTQTVLWFMDTISSSELLLSNKKGKKLTFKDLVVEEYEIWCNFLLTEKANTYHFWRYPNTVFEVHSICSNSGLHMVVMC